jgi:hypothetical protein
MLLQATKLIPQDPKYLIKNIPDAKALTEIGFEYKSTGKSWKRREIRNKEQCFEVQVK